MNIGQEFFQDGPVLGDQYGSDRVLKDHLAQALPPQVLEANLRGFQELGERAAGDILTLGRTVETSPPRHIPYDPWGKRIDQIEVSPAWDMLGCIAVSEDLVGLPYARTYGQYSRIVQFARVYLYAASSAFYTCPLAMSDGAARAIELYGNTALMRRAFERLTTSDVKRAWTSGQWMTEREGGSDVSRTSTIAATHEGVHLLTGSKWFTSAITAPMAMTLARTPNAPAGSRGLSMFLVETRDASGAWNGITVRRLKEKLGTKGVPTAEIDLRDTPAVMVGREGKGVKQITAILNITRVWNSVQAIALMRRSIALARDYGYRREVFGKKLSAQPPYWNDLARLETEFRGAFALTFYVIELLGKEETHTSTSEELLLLRLLIPVAKLYTAEQAVAVTSDALKCFGGMGYIEDTGLPQLLRDAQVLPTWEGAPTVLALDVLRVVESTDALDAWVNSIRLVLMEVMADAALQSVSMMSETLLCALIRVKWSLEAVFASSAQEKEFAARDYAYAIARITIGWLLLRVTVSKMKTGACESELEALTRWIDTPLFVPTHRSLEASRKLALGE